jgi:hypothetical protein
MTPFFLQYVFTIKKISECNITDLDPALAFPKKVCFPDPDTEARNAIFYRETSECSVNAREVIKK